MKVVWPFLIFLSLMIMLLCSSDSQGGDIRNSKHNLARWSTNVYRSENYDEICVFCHTPHMSVGMWPLWNRVYDYNNIVKVYSSKGVVSTTPVDEHTKLCYSCHEAIGLSVSLKTAPLSRPSIYANRAQPAFSFGKLPATKLFTSGGVGGDHPVSMNYVQFEATGKFRLRPKMIVESKLGADTFKGDQFVCTSCHSSAGVHGGTVSKMLRVPNTSSKLCEGCHLVTPN